MARDCQGCVGHDRRAHLGWLEADSLRGALVGSLLEPSVYGLSAIPDMTANAIAGWPIALVPPAVQGMNWNAQHFRDIRERHELVSCLECHDHLPSRGYLVSGQAFGPSSQRGELDEGAGVFAQAARSDRSNSHRDWRLSEDLSRETTVGGREQQQELKSHDQLGRNPRAHTRANADAPAGLTWLPREAPSLALA
jgi:hypothetical protein